ncbi:hypothetical protein NEFER03_2133 [Nematocida sp. LUAm3]|nr:hypothetical protein NEFER03_2133 [Nematocida sp. LUAm3]KAI5174604.1 hypothetical protein NEFER02_0725 [Nematocida sp. LUAm2]KAI5177990.1 hypothetical protein NEFER01_1172 [Nematocida sp. LUAm1]
MIGKDKKQTVICLIRCVFVLAASTSILCSEMPLNGKHKEDIQNTQHDISNEQSQPMPSSSTQALHAIEQQGVSEEVLEEVNPAINAEETEHLSKEQKISQETMALKISTEVQQEAEKEHTTVQDIIYTPASIATDTKSQPSTSRLTTTVRRHVTILSSAHTIKTMLETISKKLEEKNASIPFPKSEDMPLIKFVHTQMEFLIKKKDKLSISVIHKGITELLKEVLKCDIPRKIKQFKKEKETINMHCFNSNILSKDAICNRIALYIYNSNPSNVTYIIPDLKSIHVSNRLEYIQDYILSNVQQKDTTIHTQSLEQLELKKLIEMDKLISSVLELGQIIIAITTDAIIKENLSNYFSKLSRNASWNVADQTSHFNKVLPIAYFIQNILKHPYSITETNLVKSLANAKRLTIYNLRILGYAIYWEIVYRDFSLGCFKKEAKDTPYNVYNRIQYELPEEFVMYSRSVHLPRINAYNSIKSTAHSDNIQPEYRYNPFEATRVLAILLSENIDKFNISNNDILKIEYRCLSYHLPASVRVELIELIRASSILEAKLLIILHIAYSNSTPPKLVSVWYVQKYLPQKIL